MSFSGMALNGLILAGGLSSRMGRDKALLPIGDESLLMRLAKQMSPRVHELVIACGGAEKADSYRLALAPWDERRFAWPKDEENGLSANSGAVEGESLRRPAVRYVTDRYPGEGPLAGLQAGLAVLPEGYAFVAACDLPDVSLGLLDALVEAAHGGADVVCLQGQPFHALYHTRVAAAAQSALERGERRMMAFLDGLKVRTLPVESYGKQPANLNTQEDYASYLSHNEKE